MDFVLRIYFHKCSENGIRFLNLKYHIPHSASKQQRDSVGFHEIKWVGYADDLVIMFEDVTNFNMALNLLQKVFADYGLEMNTTKTKTIILNYQGSDDNYPSTISSINNTPLDNVKVFMYLGCNIKYNEATTGNT